MHLYWTGVAANMAALGDERCAWILDEAVAGHVFAAAHGEIGNDAGLFASTTVADLRAFLEGKVAHWQVPERWAVIEEVPKTSVGKFDKKLLRKRFADGDLDVVTLR